MKIAIDARWIFSEISGIGEYTRELIRHLARDPGRHDYTLIFQDPALLERTRAELALAESAPIVFQRVPYGLFSPRNQIALPPLLRRLNIRVFHSPNYMLPLLAFPRHGRGPLRAVVTIHDVIPLLFPDHAPRSKKSRVLPLYRALMRSIGRRADRILTDSAASARDLIRELAIPPDQAGKVLTVYCGVSTRFVPPVARPSRAADVPRTLLYVGRADPYKNLTGLIRAFEQARALVPVPLELIIAGAPDPRYPEAQQLVYERGLEPHVHWTGYVPDGLLTRLYQEADALLHCSRYEGFGLQVVEAMACGTPVICSRAGSLPEVVGDAALLADPDDVETFARHVATVLTRPDVAAQLRARGLARAATFTWAATAARTREVYDELEAS